VYVCTMTSVCVGVCVCVCVRVCVCACVQVGAGVRVHNDVRVCWCVCVWVWVWVGGWVGGCGCDVGVRVHDDVRRGEQHREDREDLRVRVLRELVPEHQQELEEVRHQDGVLGHGRRGHRQQVREHVPLQVCSLGFRVQGSVFRVTDLGCRV